MCSAIPETCNVNVISNAIWFRFENYWQGKVNQESVTETTMIASCLQFREYRCQIVRLQQIV